MMTTTTNEVREKIDKKDIDANAMLSLRASTQLPMHRTILLQERKKIRMHNVKSAISFPRLDNARDINLTGA